MSADDFSSPGSAEAMESGNKFQARFSPVAVIYELTWWGTGECSPCGAGPELCPLLLARQELGSSGALPAVSARVLGFVGESAVLRYL